MNKNTFKFLETLKLNNNRDGFMQNKSEYDAIKQEFESDIELLLGHISSFDEEISGIHTKDCVYRIYRDMRFSTDKTPYKTNLGAFITKFGKKLGRAGYYLHIEPGCSMICAGLWFPSSDILKRQRRAIYDNIDEFTEIINNKEFLEYFGGLNLENSLKKIPAGYDKDFEYPELLKLKDFGVVKYLPDNFFFNKNWIDEVALHYKSAKPLNDFLNYTIDEIITK